MILPVAALHATDHASAVLSAWSYVAREVQCCDEPAAMGRPPVAKTGSAAWAVGREIDRERERERRVYIYIYIYTYSYPCRSLTEAAGAGGTPAAEPLPEAVLRECFIGVY